MADVGGIRGRQLVLKYMHGGEVVYQPGDSLGPRVLNDFELVHIIEGSVVYEADGQQYSEGTGGLILGLPGTVERYQWDTDHCTRHVFVRFDIEQCPAEWPEHWPRVFTKASPICAKRLDHILQHIYEHEFGPEVRLSSMDCRLLTVLLDTLIEPQYAVNASFERDRPEPVRRALMPIRRITEENPHYPLSLYELALESHVTEKHLCRLFARWISSPVFAGRRFLYIYVQLSYSVCFLSELVY